VGTGKDMGKHVVALVTNMNQPLGCKVGNALEVFEALEVLSGAGPDDLRELCVELSAWMLYLGGRTKTVAEGKTAAAALIASGAAREKFREIVKLHDGDVSIVDDPKLLPRARYTSEVVSPADGYIADVDCEQLGMASVVLGGGRETQDDAIDSSVGLEVQKRIGDAVQRGETICTLFYNAGERAKEAHRRVEASFRVEQEKPATTLPLIHSVIT
jgi:pyrimidine-nucleoside phosphorylase